MEAMFDGLAELLMLCLTGLAYFAWGALYYGILIAFGIFLIYIICVLWPITLPLAIFIGILFFNKKKKLWYNDKKLSKDVIKYKDNLNKLKEIFNIKEKSDE